MGACNGSHADNGVHRRSDIVTHSGKKFRFGPVGDVCGVQRILKQFFLLSFVNDFGNVGAGGQKDVL